MARVLLIAMPFFSVRYPTVGISLLKPRLKQFGFACDVRYFSIPFAEWIGLDRYDEICHTHTQTALVGEWLFAQSHFGAQLPPVSDYLRHLEPYFAASKLTPADLGEMCAMVPAFLDDCLGAVEWDRYDVVGFSTSCEQNLAAVALASRLKTRHPEIRVVFGGANCEGEMGLELHRVFPCIDYVCSGEADQSLPELVRRLAEGLPTHDLRGVVSRVEGRSHFPGEAAPLRDLDSLPYPDYDDYFAALEASTLTRAVSAAVPLETSRGCWWGARHHCTFCGLKDSTMVYRSKTPERALAEIRALVDRYRPEELQVVDNILDLRYFRGLIPELKRLRLPVRLFYETKANLTKRQVRSLAEAGVTWLQPGIENLDSHILQLMDKGITGLQNVQLLKWCKQFGIYPTWNLLTGFPGERDEDYARLLEVMGKVTNLNPPEGFAAFALYRFAPYFTAAARYGIENVRPEKTYRFIYPFREDVLINLGYYLEFDYAPEVRPSLRYRDLLAAAVDEWKRRGADGERSLSCFSPSPGELCIEDRRDPGGQVAVTLTGVQAFIYRFCDAIHTVPAVLGAVRGAFPDLPVRRRDVQDFLDHLVALGLMLEEDGRYLSIAVSLDAEEPTDEDDADQAAGLVTFVGAPSPGRQG